MCFVWKLLGKNVEKYLFILSFLFVIFFKCKLITEMGTNKMWIILLKKCLFKLNIRKCALLYLHNLLLLLFFVTLSWLWVGLSQDMSNVTSFVNCPANPLRVCVICFAICIAFVSLWTFINLFFLELLSKIFVSYICFIFSKSKLSQKWFTV